MDEETLGPEHHARLTMEIRQLEFREHREFPVENVIELLIANGFKDPSSVFEILETWSEEAIERFSADLFDFLDQSRHNLGEVASNSLLTASASASIRGAAGCRMYECQAKKLDILAAYAGLYADRVLLPVRLQHPGVSQEASERRDDLEVVIRTLLHLRELISAGLIHPLVPYQACCEECAQNQLTKFKAACDAAHIQAAKHLSDFRFKYRDDERGGMELGLLFVSGPEEYIEHGSRLNVCIGRPEWVPREKYLDRDFEVPTDTVRRFGLVDDIFGKLISDALFHYVFTRKFNASYLTDLPGEAEFFGLLSRNDIKSMNTAALCANLTHQLPFFIDLPISDIIRIRTEIPEAFEAYRTRLTSLARKFAADKNTITSEDAKGIYRDEIEPAVANLALRVVNERKRRLKKSSVYGAVALGAISLGATGILDARQLSSIVCGAAGVRLLDCLTDSQDISSAANDSFYFLLRLQQRSKGFRK